jgi:Zn-dependent protease with chaperone function
MVTPQNQLKLSVPFGMRIKTVLALSVSLTFLIGFYFFLFIFAWWAFFIMIIIPIIAVLVYHPTGFLLERKEAPRLFAMLDDITGKLKVKLPKVIMVGDSSIAVTGVFRKRLLLGMGALLQLKQDELYAILVHEMAHLKGLDSIVGAWLNSINIAITSILRFFQKLPVWHIFITVIYYMLLLYFYIYNFFNLAYSRQREFLADRYAALLAGSNTFGKALTNSIIYTKGFENSVIKAIVNAGIQNKRFLNIYTEYQKHVLNKRLKHMKVLEKDVLSAKESWLATHPSLKRRLKIIKDLPKRTPAYRGFATALIGNVAKKQKELTGIMTQKILKKAKIRKQGNVTVIEAPSLG